MIEFAGYKLQHPEAIQTPAMLVWEHLVDANIRTVTELAGGADRLMVHVKTHKCLAVARKQAEAGIRSFKCAILPEVEMVLQAGAERVFLAYPQLQSSKIEKLLDLADAYPEATVMTQASSAEHIALLGDHAARRQRPLKVVLDIDVGLHRTGIAPGPEAAGLYRQIAAHPGLEPAGLHGYDGQDHFTDLVVREQSARRHISRLSALRDDLIGADLPVPVVIGGSSFSFPYFTQAPGFLGSPGTFIYWDRNYQLAMPDMPFHWAALVLTQVVDRHPEAGSFTLDIGAKAVATDSPQETRAGLIGRDDVALAVHHEEHGVFACSGDLPALGSYLLAAPGHVCPTTVLYRGSHVIDRDGNVSGFWEHSARDR